MIIVLMDTGEHSRFTQKGITPMHDLLIGLTFVGMVISPAIVAAFSDSSEANADND